MKKLLFILLTMYYALFTLANANSVEAVVASNEIVEGNMAQLKIKAVGNRVTFPVITQINGVPVLGRHKSQNNSYTYINGRMTNKHTTTQVLTFSPKKDMTIPSYKITIDGTVHTTDPIDIKVVKASAPHMNSSSKFSLQLRSNKKSVIVGEPIVATVYFSVKNGVRLSDNPQYTKPEFKGFFVKEIQGQKNYTDGTHQITELKYILIPKSEGNFTVGPASGKMAVADRSRRDMFGRFYGTNWVPVISNTLNIEVKAQAAESDLVGSFTIEHSLDSQKVKANKPVNLTVTIKGEGSLEDFEFPQYEIDGVTVYSDDAKVSTEVTGSTIQSTYVKSFAFISDHAFTIPARSISVYNTKDKAVKTLDIPAYEIKVKGSTAVAVIPTAAKKTPVNNGVVQTNIKVPESSMLDSTEAKTEEVPQTVIWWIPLLAFFSGIFVMYLARYLPVPKWKSKESVFKESEALKILYAHINESSEIEEMVRKLYARKNGDKSVVIDKKLLKELVEKINK